MAEQPDKITRGALLGLVLFFGPMVAFYVLDFFHVQLPDFAGRSLAFVCIAGLLILAWQTMIPNKS